MATVGPMHQYTEKHYGSTRVTAGARVAGPVSDLRFTVFAVCVSATPETWAGEVRYDGTLLATTPHTSDPYEAHRAAAKVVKDRIVELFTFAT